MAIKAVTGSAPWRHDPTRRTVQVIHQCQRCGRDSKRKFYRGYSYVCNDCRTDVYWMTKTGNAPEKD